MRRTLGDKRTRRFYPRKNVKLWKVIHMVDLARNEAVRAFLRLGRALFLEKLERLPPLILVETKMHSVGVNRTVCLFLFK